MAEVLETIASSAGDGKRDIALTTVSAAKVFVDIAGHPPPAPPPTSSA